MVHKSVQVVAPEVKDTKLILANVSVVLLHKTVFFYYITLCLTLIFKKMYDLTHRSCQRSSMQTDSSKQ